LSGIRTRSGDSGAACPLVSSELSARATNTDVAEKGNGEHKLHPGGVTDSGGASGNRAAFSRSQAERTGSRQQQLAVTRVDCMISGLRIYDGSPMPRTRPWKRKSERCGINPRKHRE
jgi:hypothetical protein